MPAIPLPPASSTGQFNQRAMSLPEFRARATPDAFGANVAEAELSGSRRLASLTEEANRAEAGVYNAIGGAINKTVSIVGEQIQKDWKLEAETNLNEMAIERTRRAENEEPTGDGSYTRGVLEGFDERGRELVDNAASPFQANIYREGLQRLRFQAERSAVASEAAAVKQNRIDQAQRLTEAAEIEVFRSPGSLLDVRNRTIEAINSSALSPRQRRTMVEAFDKRIHAQAIESHIVAGRIGDAEAMLKQDGTIAALGGLESVRMQARIDKAGREARDRAAGVTFLGQVARGEARLDPQNPEQMATLDRSWDLGGGDRELAASNPNAAANLANIARVYGAVPKGALSLLNGMALNGTPAQQAYALSTVASLDSARPGVVKVSGAHDQLRSEGDDFRFWTVQMGIDAEDAVRRINATRTPEFRAQHEARKADATRLTTNRSESEIANVFDSTALQWDAQVGADPRTRDLIVAAYRRAFRAHYERTGQEDVAVAAAQADMKRTYGATRISGEPGRLDQGRIMRHPVELRFPQVPTMGGSHEWAAVDLDAFVATHAGRAVPRQYRYYDNLPGNDDAIARGKAPSYVVSWYDPDKKTWQTAPAPWTPNIINARDKALLDAGTEHARRASEGRDRTQRPLQGIRPEPTPRTPVAPGRLPDPPQGFAEPRPLGAR